MGEGRKVAAILAADVVGFSRLIGADEEATLARMRALRSDLFNPAVEAHGGRVVKRMGDGVIVEFRSVVEAVRCAIEVTKGLADRNAGIPPDRRIEVRTGIHLGDVVEEADGDLLGDGVNIAARLEGICEPGGVCLSEDAWRQVRQAARNLRRSRRAAAQEHRPPDAGFRPGWTGGRRPRNAACWGSERRPRAARKTAGPGARRGGRRHPRERRAAHRGLRRESDARRESCDSVRRRRPERHVESARPEAASGDPVRRRILARRVESAPPKVSEGGDHRGGDSRPSGGPCMQRASYLRAAASARAIARGRVGRGARAAPGLRLLIRIGAREQAPREASRKRRRFPGASPTVMAGLVPAIHAVMLRKRLGIQAPASARY